MKIIKELEACGFDCVIIKDGKTLYCANGRGILPLYNAYVCGRDFSGATLLDKVCGYGAACLAAEMKISVVKAALLSEKAAEHLKQRGVGVKCDRLVKTILNHSGTDMCPLEKRLENVRPENAPAEIEAFVKSIAKN